MHVLLLNFCLVEMSYLRLFLILFPCLYLVFWLFILFRFVSNHLFVQTGQFDLGAFVCWESACLAEQSCVSTSRLVAECENSVQTLQNRICISLSVRLRCLATHLYLWSAQAAMHPQWKYQWGARHTCNSNLPSREGKRKSHQNPRDTSSRKHQRL